MTSQAESHKLWESLVQLSRRFLRASTIDEIVDALAQHLKSTLGFPHLVIYEFKAKSVPAIAQLWKVRGDHPTVDSVPVDGDAILTEVLGSTEPIVVEDARTDPRTNKDVVAAKGSRTLVFLPMPLADGTRLFVSTGTFGEESWSPDQQSLDYLAALGYDTGLALDRMRIFAEQEFLSAEVAHAEKMELLGRMVGSGAHELRNILTSISGYTALLSELVERDSDVGDLTPKIERAANRATQVVKDLLAFSRQGKGQGEALDLNQVIGDLRGMLGSLLAEEAQLQLKFAPNLHEVSLRKSQLEQLLVHLVANASEACGDRGTITITTENTGPRFAHQGNPDWVGLSVSDDGPGLLPEVAARVFDPFFSTRAPSTHPGLGLTTCYGIVHQAGGQISIDTAPGRGTTVNVRFPSNQASAPDNGRLDAPPAPAVSGVDGFSRALVALCRGLLRAKDFSEIVEAARIQVQATLGLRAVFLYLAQGDPPEAIELWLAQGQDLLIPQTLPADHSQLIIECLTSDGPVVLEDCLTDPRTNKETIKSTGLRTLVVIPFDLTDGRRGGLGTGTFGEEGVRSISSGEIEFLMALSSLTVVALDRRRMLEAHNSARKRFLRGQHLEAVTQLGRGLADDLRNALTGIDGFTHLALDSLTEEHPARTTLQKIVKSSNRASQLVNKLVAFAGPETVAPTMLDVNQVLHGLRPLLQHLAGDRRVKIQSSPRTCHVECDWEQLEQVVLNLAFNGIEASPPGGTVSLSTEVSAREVHLLVKDSGQGMSEEVLSMAFEPFFTTKPPKLGTGLGLPTCKRIITQAGGTISLNSQPGQGTEVVVTLPCRFS